MTRLPLLATLLAALPAWALDLTPMDGVRELEGVKIPVVEFSDVGRRIQFRPPADWRPSGGGNALQLDSPSFGQSFMKLLVLNKTPETIAAQEVSSEIVQNLARRLLSKDAQSIVVTKESPTPFTLEGRPSLELTLSYVLFSRREMMSVAVVNRSETQWFVLLVSANEHDFDAIHSQAISSMFSWRAVRN